MLSVHNTLGNKTEPFSLSPSEKVRMFVCGPTVYDYSHLGHAKTYVQFDVIARALRYMGYDLFYLQNITDIDDKIIRRAKENGVSPKALAEEFEQYYLEDVATLNIMSVDKYARATDYIPAIVSQVKRLVDGGYAYKISDGYYFDIKKFADYGKLSGRNEVKENDAVSRIDENPEKRNPGDFCLWKFKREDEPFWTTDIGEGRPGWHIEDTAITESEFGPQYEIHGGAIDLIFPHHEAEITQMESISGKKPFVRYWLHAGFLNTKSEKMSKSLGNFMTIREMTKKINPLALRYYFLGSHYRSPLNFTEEALDGAQNAYRKLKDLVSSWPSGGSVDEKYKKEFVAPLEDDFNTPQALAVVWKLSKDEELSPADRRATLLNFDKVLGLKLDINEFELKEVPGEISKLVDEREQARKDKDFNKSDELRAEIEKMGFVVEDSPSGPKISNK